MSMINRRSKSVDPDSEIIVIIVVEGPELEATSGFSLSVPA